jgi:hypothetical protein
MKGYYVIVVITGLTGGRSTMERDIKGKVYDGLEYLHSRADFWRQQKPMYARKRDREKTRRSGKGESYRDPRSYILRSLDEIEEGRLNKGVMVMVFNATFNSSSVI